VCGGCLSISYRSRRVPVAAQRATRLASGLAGNPNDEFVLDAAADMLRHVS
jgi:hypothetical protein